MRISETVEKSGHFDAQVRHCSFAGKESSRTAGLVAVHGHSLRAPAYLTLSSRADGPAATARGVCAGLPKSHELLGAERLVVCLGGRLDEVLEMGSQEEVAQVDELAVVLVLDIDDTPSVLAAAHLLAIDDNVLLRTDNGEGNMALLSVSIRKCFHCIYLSNAS
jgi:hypothetical protein